MKTKYLIILAAFIILSGCNNGGLKHRACKDYRNCSECSQTARDLAWSLENESSEWNNDGFAICKASDAPCIWYANGKQFLSVGKNRLGAGWEPKGLDS